MSHNAAQTLKIWCSNRELPIYKSLKRDLWPNFASLCCSMTYFLCCGLCLAFLTFLAFLSWKTRNMQAQSFYFQLTLNSRKKEKILGFCVSGLCSGLQNFFGLFQFFWPFDIHCSSNYSYLSQFCGVFTRNIFFRF